MKTPAPACTAFGNGAKGACALRPPPRGSLGKEGSGCGSSLLPHGTPPALGLPGTTSETNYLPPHILISGSAFRGTQTKPRGSGRCLMYVPEATGEGVGKAGVGADARAGEHPGRWEGVWGWS